LFVFLFVEEIEEGLRGVEGWAIPNLNPIEKTILSSTIPFYICITTKVCTKKCVKKNRKSSFNNKSLHKHIETEGVRNKPTFPKLET